MLHVARTISGTLGCVSATEMMEWLPEMSNCPLEVISCANWAGVVLVGIWPVADNTAVNSQQLTSSCCFRLAEW